ncbi:MAG: polysaccharide deacetylase [Faecousia sp.]
MDEQDRVPARRRRKRRPKWQRMLHKYWPPIRLGLIALIFVLVIALGISLVVKNTRSGSSGSTPTNQSNSQTTPAPTTEPPTAEEIKASAEALMKKADFVAAGYDYLGAIDMLTAFEYYDDFPEMAAKIDEYRAEDAKLVTFKRMDSITHIFFHSLIVDTDRAFDGDEDEDGYNQYMTTCDEFWKILESMYARGYVLVSPYDVAYEVEGPDGAYFVNGVIRLPEGKTPFLMSQDDLNYYSYMIGTGSGINETPVFADTNGDGFASKIVIGEDGYPTCEYMDKDGNITYGDYDLVPLLEKFIQLHPDFSYHGARAILGFTGYEGVLGYRTKPSYEAALGTERYQQECEEAKKVAQCLRDHGWVLASHSYGHPRYGNIDASRVEADSDKWENTVQPIIGDCDIILYPNGSDIAGIEQYTFDNAKFKALYEDGYRYFFNVDSHTAWVQLGPNYYRGGRRNLDGYRMWYNPDKLADLFDVDEVFDAARPTPVPKI